MLTLLALALCAAAPSSEMSLDPAEADPQPEAIPEMNLSELVESSRPETRIRLVGELAAGATAAAVVIGGFQLLTYDHCIGGWGGWCSTEANLGAVNLLALGPGLLSVAAFAGHRLAGGRSSYGWSLLGTIGGGVLGFAVSMLMGSLFTPAFTPLPVGTVVTAAGALAGATIGLELSDRIVSSNLAPSVVPVPGGAALGLSGAF